MLNKHIFFGNFAAAILGPLSMWAETRACLPTEKSL